MENISGWVLVLIALTIIINLAWIFTGSLLLVISKFTNRENFSTFNDVVKYEKDYRNIFIPAISAIPTGVIISISASLLYDSYTEYNEVNPAKLLWGVMFLFLAVGTLALFLIPALKKRLTVEDIARTPQRLLLALQDFTRNPIRSNRKLLKIKREVDKWPKRSGAAAFQLSPKREYTQLNESLNNLPPKEDLGIIDSFHLLEDDRIIKEFISESKILYGTLLLFTLTFLGGSIYGLLSASEIPWVSFALIIFTALSIEMFWLGTVHPAAKRFSMNKFYYNECRNILKQSQEKNSNKHYRVRTK